MKTAIIEPRRVASTRPNKATLGVANMVPMLSAMRRRPRSYEDLQRISGIGRTAVRAIIAAMRAVQLVHIAGWSARYRAPFSPLFAYGHGQDVPAPTVRPDGRESQGHFPAVSPKPRTNIVALAAMIRAIEAEPCSLDDLVDITGASMLMVVGVVAALRKHRMAYIADHVERSTAGGPARRLFAAGARRDAVAEAMGTAERQRRHREGRKARREMLRLMHALAGTHAQQLEPA